MKEKNECYRRRIAPITATREGAKFVFTHTEHALVCVYVCLNPSQYCLPCNSAILRNRDLSISLKCILNMHHHPLQQQQCWSIFNLTISKPNFAFSSLKSLCVCWPAEWCDNRRCVLVQSFTSNIFTYIHGYICVCWMCNSWRFCWTCLN